MPSFSLKWRECNLKRKVINTINNRVTAHWAVPKLFFYNSFSIETLSGCHLLWPESVKIGPIWMRYDLTVLIALAVTQSY